MYGLDIDLQSFISELHVTHSEEAMNINSDIVYNKKLVEAREALYDLKNNLQLVEVEERYLKVQRDEVVLEKAKLKTGRLTDLEIRLSDDLKDFFQKSNYELRFDIDESRGVPKAILESKSLAKGWTVVKSSEGGFFVQETGISVITFISELIGSSTLLFDEVLSNADKYNITKLKKLLNNILERGINILYIEHREEYKKIPGRREIQLFRDEETNVAKITSITDYDENNEVVKYNEGEEDSNQ